MLYVFSFPPTVYVGTLNLIASIPGPSILTSCMLVIFRLKFGSRTGEQNTNGTKSGKQKLETLRLKVSPLVISYKCCNTLAQETRLLSLRHSFRLFTHILTRDIVPRETECVLN